MLPAACNKHSLHITHLALTSKSLAYQCGPVKRFCFFTFLPLPAVNLHWLDSRGSHSAPETCLRLSPTLIGFAWTYTESGPQQNSDELAGNFKVIKDFKQRVFLTFNGTEVFKAQVIVKNLGVHNNELGLVLVSHTAWNHPDQEKKKKMRVEIGLSLIEILF